MKKYFIMVLSLTALSYGGNQTPHDIIKNYQQTIKKVESISYDYNLLRIQLDSTISSPQIEKFEVQVKTDGDRIDHRAKIWANYSERNNTNIKSIKPREKSFLWDGSSFYMYRRISGIANTNSQAFIERNDNEKQGHLAVNDGSSPLRGIMGGDYDRIDTILKKSDSLKVLSKKEKIGDSDCYVLIAKGKHGKYKVWFDPEHGYNIARAKVLKKQDDIAWRGMPLAPRITDYSSQNKRLYANGKHPGMKDTLSFVIEDITFKEIDGVWVPITANWQNTVKHVNGRTVIVKSALKCDNININPKYNKKDFKPDNIADGTLVAIIPSQIKYTWINGKPVPKTDRTNSPPSNKGKRNR